MVLESTPELLASLGLTGNSLAALGAAFGIGVAGISAARGLGIAGCTGAGVIAEDEKHFSSAIIFQALPQTQVIYGFIIGILIILGVMGGELSVTQGWLCLAAGVAVGLTAVSAIAQGQVASASIGAAAKNPNVRGKALILVVMPEIAALLGFVVAIMLLTSGDVF